MKKRTKIIGLCVAVIVLIAVILICVFALKPKKEFAVYDKSGKVIATLEKWYTLEDFKLVYCDVAITQASEILSEKYNCSVEKAKSMLWEKDFQVYTYYESDVQSALAAACMKYKKDFSCGGAVTDLQGNIVAAYGHGVDHMDVNYAMHATSPYSSLKPLSVYAQAIEKGVINWSSTYEDSAYKQIESSDGSKRDWPTNANGEYSSKDVTIYEGIRKSLNTMAVKCLKDVGILSSIEFLQSNFEIPLSSERYTATVHGEEEIIGNIAMGYLKEGVTPIDMAGYYQIFATGGVYDKPSTIYKICDAEGKELYTREYAPKEIISPLTADLMNKLLQGVAKTGGTGVEAHCKSTEVAGKTGSADGNEQCWFAGVTPEYSCAIWHDQNYKNLAPVLFSRTMDRVYEGNTDLKNVFAMHSNLQKFMYCEESGMGISKDCTLVQMGYYVPGTQLETCNKH